MTIGRRALFRALATAGLACVALAAPVPAQAELRINLSVFLNDFDVTVQVVLLGAIPEALYESLQTGLATHVRLQVELWQYNRFAPDRRLLARTVERQVVYNVLTRSTRSCRSRASSGRPISPRTSGRPSAWSPSSGSASWPRPRR